MYFPAGKWKISANGVQGTLDINFVDISRFIGSVFGRKIEGRFDNVTGNVSFATVDGTFQLYTGALVIPRSATPECATYIQAGMVTDLSGSYPWVAEQYVIP